MSGEYEILGDAESALLDCAVEIRTAHRLLHKTEAKSKKLRKIIRADLKEIERLRSALEVAVDDARVYRAALERIAKYRSKEYKTNEQGHFCMFRSAFEGCRDIARGALKDA